MVDMGQERIYSLPWSAWRMLKEDELGLCGYIDVATGVKRLLLEFIRFMRGEVIT